MKKKIIFFLFIFCFSILPVKADLMDSFVWKKRDNLENNVPKMTGIEGVSCGGQFNRDHETTDETSTTYLSKNEIKTQCSEGIPYSIVVMVDATQSMRDGDKISQTNIAIQNLINSLKASGRKDRITFIKFGSNTSGTEIKNTIHWYKIGNLDAKDFKNYLVNDSNLQESTNIQRALKTAYDQLSGDVERNSSRKEVVDSIPMVILITDGYPTQGYYSYNIDDFGREIDYPKSSASSVRVYYTAKSFASLKTKMKSLGYTYSNDAKVITIGVGMDKNDEYGKFILQPNKTTYDNLNNKSYYDLYGTASKHLYNYVKGNGIYNYVIRKEGFPDAGVFGVTDINKLGNILYFKISKKQCERYKKAAKGEKYSVYINDQWIDYVEPPSSCTPAAGKDYVFFELDARNTAISNKVKDLFSRGIIKKVKLNDEANKIKLKSDDSKWLSSFGSSGPVDNNLMGSPKDVANGISNIVRSVTSMCNVTSNFNSQALKYESEKYGIEKFGQSKFANVNLYDYVMNKKIGNVYYRIPSTFTFKNGKIEGLKFYSTKNFNSDKVGTKEGKICIPIDTRSLNIDIQYTEYSKFSVDLGSVSYAGNGFTASGHLFSEVMFRYGTLMKNDHGFGVNFNLAGLEYYLVTGNSDDYYVISNMNGTFITYKSMSNVSISDLFTDENCSDGSAFWKKESDEEGFRKFIIDKIKGKADEEFGKDIESDKTIFSSVDSNDSKKSDVPIKTTTSLDNPDGNYSFHSYGVLDGNTTTGGNFTFTYEYSVKLNRACGALSSVTVGGKTYENGFINYMDTLDGNCLEFGTPGSYKDNGNKYYIPVDYSQKKVQLKVNNVNLSVAGFPLNYDLTCEIDVDRGALKYVYRSVDVDSPFPKENISSNWKDWYSIEANRSRLSTTFNREPLYEIVINKYDNNDGNAFISKITDYNNVSYTSWNNMRNNNSDGRSSFICGTNNKSGVGFDKAYCSTNYNDSSFCPLGFIGNNCDKRW